MKQGELEFWVRIIVRMLHMHIISIIIMLALVKIRIRLAPLLDDVLWASALLLGYSLAHKRGDVNLGFSKNSTKHAS